MSRSYWLPIIAVVGLILATASGKVGAENSPNHPNGHIQQHQSDTAKVPPSRETNNPAGTPIQTAAEKRSELRELENLRQQIRMADTARDQVHVSEWQNGFVALEAILLAITIYFTAQAAWAASEGTKAANRAIAQSEEHARISLRAYLSVNPFFVGITPVERNGTLGAIVVTIKCRVRNTGVTPAEAIMAGADIRTKPWPPASDDVFVFNGTPECISTGDIGREAEITHQFVKFLKVDFERLKLGQDRIILTGKLIYSDLWKNSHLVEFQGYLDDVYAMMDLCKIWVPGTKITVPLPDISFAWRHPACDGQKESRKE
jgi:hypothetical protein